MKISKDLSLRIVEYNVLFTILIVWLHTSSIFGVSSEIQNIAIVSVPCFFTISSFLYFLSFDFGDIWTCYKHKVSQRVKSLLIPFVLFNILAFISSIVLYYFHPVDYFMPDDIKKMGIIKFVYESVANGPLWYLRALFEFILVAPLVGWVIHKSKWSILLIIPLFFLGRYFRYSSFPYWIVNIFCGAWCAIYYDWLCGLKLLYINILKIGGVLLGIAGLIFISDAYVLRCIIPIFFMSIMGIVHIMPRAFALFISTYTMFIYCSHSILMRVAGKIPLYMGLENQVISAILATILTIAFALVIGIMLQKIPSIWKVLTGGR